ncbi:MAG: DEAD/DEAH box helicase [Roseateles sp.]|uniref:DEAD/DEAH box helicase n=1 Tax=Roseateles sp. TaxID=1971397 RepID=UPI0040360F57
MSFDSLGLAAPLLKAIADAGYTTPTPIQAQAIPAVLNGGDLLAGAQTGTGKTAGFTLPLLHRLSTGEKLLNKRGKIAIRALVLTPTRELAAQVEESVQTYGKYLPLKSMVMFGGVGMQPQINKLRDGVDILVATPGRLLDHAQQGTLDLSQVQILVLDEADRMLDMGFVHDIKKVLALLPAKKQSLLFSATFSDEIKNLADRLLNAPALIEVARRNQTNDAIAQKVHPVGRERKKELLAHLIKGGQDGEPWHQVLIFTRMKHGANRLTDYLNDQGISAMAIHGNKSQGARTKALADFKAGDLTCLVATDIAARGIDIDQLPHVVNFELPNVAEDYVHRIGRTGRAGAQGEAVSLVCVDENGFLKEIERLIKREIPREIVPGFAPDPNERAEPIVLGRTVLNPNGSRGRNPNPPAGANGRGGGGGRGGRPGGGGGGGGRGGESRGGSRDGGRDGQGRSAGKPAGHTGVGGAKTAPKPHAEHAPRAAGAQPARGNNGGAPRHNNGPRLTQPKR